MKLNPFKNDLSKHEPTNRAPAMANHQAALTYRARIATPNFTPEASSPVGEAGIKHYDFDSLLGASVYDSVSYGGTHLAIEIFDELTKSIEVIENKLQRGTYDAQAIPLVEAYLQELRKLGHVEMRQNELREQRLNELKEANIAAFKAVSAARHDRESYIDQAQRNHQEQIARLSEKKRLRNEAKFDHDTESEERIKPFSTRLTSSFTAWWKSLKTDAAQRNQERKTARTLRHEAKAQQKTTQQLHKQEREQLRLEERNMKLKLQLEERSSKQIYKQKLREAKLLNRLRATAPDSNFDEFMRNQYHELSTKDLGKLPDETPQEKTEVIDGEPKA